MTLAAFKRSIVAYTKVIGEESRAQVQREAARVVKETRTASPAPPAYKVTIGGTARAVYDRDLPELNLRQNDAVELYFDHRREVVLGTVEFLRLLSPVKSGTYQNSFEVFINGQEAPGLLAALPLIVPGVSLQIINVTPYARKLEVGKRKDGSPFVLQVPPGIVERAGGKLAATKFKRLSDIFFTYRDIDDAWILRGSEIGSTYSNNLGKRTKRKAWADRRAGESVRYPAVIIRERNYAGV